MARAFNALVQGPFCNPVLCVVVGKTAPPADVTNLTATLVTNGLVFKWDEDAEVDYAATELRLGTTWATADELMPAADVRTWTWVGAEVGSYTVLAKNYDTSGNPSTDATSVAVTVTGSDAVGWSDIGGKPLDLFNMCITPVFENGSMGDWLADDVATATGQAFTKYLQLNARDTFETGSQTPVAAGETLYAYATLSSQGNSYPVSFGFAGMNSSGSYISFSVCGTVPPGTSWTRVGGSAVVPAGVITVVPWCQINNAGGGSPGSAGGTQFYLGRAAPGAIAVADWNSDVINIPYASIYNNDDSVTFGMSLQGWPVGQAYPTGWRAWGSGSPIRETSIVRAGPTSVRWQVTGSASYGMVSTAVDTLPIGTYLNGTVDFYFVSIVGGNPGILARVYTNSALTTYVEKYVTPPVGTTGIWQRVPWTLRAGTGQQIFAIEIYLMPSPDGGHGAPGNCDIIFDNLLFELNDSSTDNTAITINANGTANGGPGGQVTIVGLGYAGSLNASSDITLLPRGGCTVTGNEVTNATGTAWGQSDCFSHQIVAGSANAMAVPTRADRNVMFGLSSNPTATEDYSSIDWAIYLRGDGQVDLFRLGARIALAVTTYAAQDIFNVLYDGVYIYFQKDSVDIVSPIPVSSGLTFQWKAAFEDVGGDLIGCQFGTYTTNNIAAQQQANQGAALNSDPSFLDLSAASSFVGCSLVTVADGAMGVSALQMSGSAYYATNRVPLSPAKTYRVSVYARWVTSGTNSLYLRLHCDNGSGTELAYSVGVEGAVTTNTWVRYEGTITPPAGTVSGVASINSNASGTGAQQFQDLRIEEVTNTDLLAPGSATTPLAISNSAGSITSGAPGSGPSGNGYNTLTINTLTWTNNTGGAVNAQYEFIITDILTSDGTSSGVGSCFYQVLINGANALPPGTPGQIAVNEYNAVFGTDSPHTYLGQVAMNAGDVIVVNQCAQVECFTGTSVTYNWASANLRLTAIKR